MLVTLNLRQRMRLLQVLPGQGNRALLKLLREGQELLSLTEDEIKEWSVRVIQHEDGRTTTIWDPKANTEKELDLSEPFVTAITGELRRMDDQGRLALEDEALCVLFLDREKENNGSS